MTFQNFGLNEAILTAIEHAGYKRPTLAQEYSIPLVLEGHDCIISAPTGTGKTAAYALPILELLQRTNTKKPKSKTVRALIVSPTRELAIQIHKNFKTYGRKSKLRSAVIYGGTDIEPQEAILKTGLDILVATPGRLLDLHKQDLVNLDHVEILVLDEADIMLDLGFVDDVKKIERLCPEHRQTLLCSATIPYKVEQLAKSILEQPERIEVHPDVIASAQVDQLLYYVPKRRKIELCLYLLEHEVKGSVLIFRRTKFGVDKLYQKLLDKGYLVEYLHGNRSQKERENALINFKRNKSNILIATDVAARGIDINALDVVINFDLPNVAETYVHRIGRTGRAGAVGKAISLCSADEKNYVKTIERFINSRLPIAQQHPFPLDLNAKPTVHKKKGSKHKKGRKSAASKKKKKRWY